jgi:hypothetical protein
MIAAAVTAHPRDTKASGELSTAASILLGFEANSKSHVTDSWADRPPSTAGRRNGHRQNARLLGVPPRMRDVCDTRVLKSPRL